MAVGDHGPTMGKDALGFVQNPCNGRTAVLCAHLLAGLGV